MTELIKELEQVLFSDCDLQFVLIDFLEKTGHFLKLETLLKLLGMQHIELEEVKCASVFH